ncbi:UNVERIFIED_ORG: plasmid stability protein [Methylobacterium sp. SuP10 SLI 274]|nr:plasmid stability protein [Methylorubrum zatmanii]MCP1556519.1 plasmid stability protein [Methylorubrum extorquens]MDF9861073.1 plasmid stability protein [Methylorubrum pseudosasae]MDH6640094.1 plasmid stability protein [Methylobacterium sp. SuP10 SLI 274]MCP1556664.1 plasmid stability protein [Methylorubrum extorquens]
MPRKRFTIEQIAFALRQAENGATVDEVCRKMGVSEPTFYRWKKQFVGMGVPEIRRLKQLEDENGKLNWPHFVGGISYAIMIARGDAMAQILVRDIDNGVKERLQQRAARNGRSMEAELRDILRSAAAEDELTTGLGTQIASLFEEIGLKPDEELTQFRGHSLADPFA